MEEPRERHLKDAEVPTGYTKFKLDYIFQAYDLAKSGASEKRIAETIGVTRQTFRKWRMRYKVLDKAIKYASRSSGSGGTTTFTEYVYGLLPPYLQVLWRQINNLGKRPDQTQIEALLYDQGKRARQHLFIHALVNSSFNVSEACRKVGVTWTAVNKWEKYDPDFRDLMKEIHLHKKNFFESALVRLIAQGDSAATIFANKTVNRDRGYSDKVQVEHTHTHTHTMVAIDTLDLPLDVKKLILQKMRDKNHPALPAHNPDNDIIDAEIVDRTAEREDD